ncbi:hypothetical protein [Chitinophaga sp. Ak27]|uniref:hypothetical protein n=1 Tax=Chitinophaga sp. Ak27 TaxID=2726116 RepID=UPI00145CCCE1|nr:hypothetical protein [Chitinophaga sp. Ak27]NLU94409.1 hypothetical protein [Chitinophaga sp. Ak27]
MSLEEQCYLLNYLIESDTEGYFKDHINLIKLELDWHIYHYGEHFALKRNEVRGGFSIRKKIIKLYNIYAALRNNHCDSNKKNVLSSVYFPFFNDALKKAGINPVSPYWAPMGKKVAGNAAIIRSVRGITATLKNASFQQLISTSFQQEIKDYQELISTFLQEQPYQALFLYTDQYFQAKVSIKAFKQQNRPSFILSHGLPGIYSSYIDSKADYLMVWGNKIKENYIKAGFSEEKILVSGHPAYQQRNYTQQTLRFDLSDVLVLAKAVSAHQHSYSPIVCDRGVLVIYLLRIKEVLQSLGVKRARLRPHPTMSVDWLLSFLGDDFFTVDTQPLPASLQRSSLVVGPTSTVLLESVFHGVNYTIFEPVFEGKDLTGYTLVPPFDGSDDNIPVAFTDSELLRMLKNKESVNPELVNTYLAPFDITAIQHLFC